MPICFFIQTLLLGLYGANSSEKILRSGYYPYSAFSKSDCGFCLLGCATAFENRTLSTLGIICICRYPLAETFCAFNVFISLPLILWYFSSRCLACSVSEVEFLSVFLYSFLLLVWFLRKEGAHHYSMI